MPSDPLVPDFSPVKVTLYTHHAVKVLVHLAASRSDGPRSARSLRCTASRNHLMKVANHLGRAGFVEAVRGRSGGIRLARPAREISRGEIVCHTESGFAPNQEQRPAVSTPSLESVVEEASRAFVGILDASASPISAGRRKAPHDREEGNRSSEGHACARIRQSREIADALTQPRAAAMLRQLSDEDEIDFRKLSERRHPKEQPVPPASFPGPELRCVRAPDCNRGPRDSDIRRPWSRLPPSRAVRGR